jgi:hypothetical protein
MKREGIPSLRQLDQDRVFHSLGAIVFFQLRAEPAGMHADRGVRLRIEIGGAPESLYGDLIFLETGCRMGEGVLGEVAQQFAKSFGPV